MKVINRKILLKTLWILALAIPFLFAISTASVYFQTIYFTKISHQLSKKMGGKINFENMYFSPFSGLILDNLYIEDDRGDTLLYAEELSVSLDDYDLRNLKIDIGSVSLKNAFYNLYSINGRDQTNMQYIINYFSTETQNDSLSSLFFLNADKINVSNLRFKYKSFVIDSVDYGVNFDDIEIYRLDLVAENYKLINDSMSLDLRALSVKEKSGLVVDDIKGFTIISGTEISVRNLVAKTPKSHVFANKFSMNYTAWGEMADFINNVKFDVNMQLSSVNTWDIGYFASFFRELNIPTFSQGRVYGTISNLKSKNVRINIGEASMIETRFSMQGLPDIDETFLSLGIKKLDLDMSDLDKILQNQTDSLETSLPVVIKRLEHIKYKGNVTGFLTDLVAYGTFKNQNGLLDTDIRFKYDTKKKDFLFGGSLKTQDLDLSVLNLSDTIFGTLSMQGKIFVEVDSLNNIKGDIDGFVQSIGINNYQYSNINLLADLQNKKIKTEILVNDSNLYLDINSTIDFSLQEPFFDIEGEFKNIKLAKINLVDRDTSCSLSFYADAQFFSLDLDKFFGELIIDSLLYCEKDKRIFSDRINLFSRKNKEERIIDLNSDLLDAHFEGEFFISSLYDDLLNYFHSYLPSIVDDQKQLSKAKQDIKYNINLKNTLTAFQIFTPEFILADSTQISGKYDKQEEHYWFDFQSRYCVVEGNNIQNPNLYIEGDYHKITSDFFAEKWSLLDNVSFSKVILQNQLKSDSLSLFLSWKDNENLQNEDAEILAEFLFYPSNLDSISVDVNLIPSFLFIEDSIWYINDAVIKLRGDQTSVENLIINHDNQYFYADGVWQKNHKDSLQIILNKLNLNYFPILEEKSKLEMEGLADGEIVLSYIKDKPIAIGNLKISDYKINEESLGDLYLTAEWENLEEKLKLNLKNSLGEKNFKSLDCSGYVDLKESSINLDVNLSMQKLSFFEPFVEEYISEIKGFVSGGINIEGPFEAVNYTGELDFSRAEIKYNYLGTRYNFSDKIQIRDNKFIFNNFKFFQVDGLGDYAEINGYIHHKNLLDYQFNIKTKLNNFPILNTSESDNKLYFGTAYLTGLAELTGTQDNLKVDISAKTEKGTYFNIPLSDNEEAVGADFISFTKIEQEEQKDTIEDYKVDLSGVELSFDLKVNPDAQIKLIFDETVGDVVKANGSGDFHLLINTHGEFKILGTYDIEKGDYLFTLQNIINKKFKIAKGSTIKWNGDPYNAYVDIVAIYHLKTPIYDLTLDPEDKERIPVECYLNMKESLLKPDILFDIKLPVSGDKAKSLISSMDSEEKNKQLLSLLVLNRFYTPDYLRGGEEIGSGNIAGKSASELLSNQLSNWLSQISDDFDIGVNYRPGDDITNDEIELALSTELFNDRVAIDGNVGVGDYKRTSSNVVGNVSVSVKVNKKGNVRVRGFNRVNDSEIESSSLYTQGVGLYYREDFDSFSKLLRKYWKAMTFQNRKDSIQ